MAFRGALRRAFGKAKEKAQYKVTETRIRHGSVKRAAAGGIWRGGKRLAIGTGKAVYHGTEYEHRKKMAKRLPHKRLEKHLFGPKGYKGRHKKRKHRRKKQEIVILFDTRQRSQPGYPRRRRAKKRKFGEFDMPEIDI